MENPSSSGNQSLLATLILGIFSWFTPERVDVGLKIITAVGAMIAAVMAARYHYYATKEKKERIRRLKKDIIDAKEEE